MDAKKAEELVEKMLTQPKVVEVDGQRIENHSAADALKTAQYFASKAAMAKRKFPVRITKMASGGAIL